MTSLKKFISKIKINSNELLQICLITVLSILLFNRRKYTFPIFIHIFGTTLLSYSFTNNLIKSLLISLLVTYVLLTIFYKLKIEKFIFNFQFDKKKETETPTETTPEVLDKKVICKIEDDSMIKMPQKEWDCDRDYSKAPPKQHETVKKEKKPNIISKLSGLLSNKFKSLF